MSARKEKKVLKYSLSDYLSGHTIDEAIKILKAKEKEILTEPPYPENNPPYTKVILSDEYEPYSDRDYEKLYMVAIRLENDQEYNERTTQENKWAEEQKTRELAALEALKKKYENK